MGNYNPHAPAIIGEEWVPVRDEDTQLTPTANLVELGHQFTIPTQRNPSTARFYVNDMDVLSDRGQTFMAALYPAGAEADSGPVQSVTIPVNFVAMSGGTLSSGTPDAVTALLTPSSSSGISLNTGNADTGLIMSFAVSQYTYLTGKRILGVNFKFGVAASANIVGPTRNTSTSQIVVAPTVGLNSGADPQALFGRLRQNGIDAAAFGEINQFWTANSPNATADRVPWTYAQLQRLDATATRLFTKIETGTNRGSTANDSVYIYYAALEVIYCDEKRVAVGATQFGTTNTSHSFGGDLIFGANQIVMHDPATGGLQPPVQAGTYTLVVSSADVGGLNDNQAQTTSAYPSFNAVRQLAQLTGHNGVRVNIPTPMTADVVGQTFTRELLDILPQLSLHTTGGVITETHVYGRVVDAQVWGSNTATQEINPNDNSLASLNTVVLQDAFGRVTANGWGLPDIGPSYFTAGGVAADYSTNGTTGRISQASVNVSRTIRNFTPLGDFRLLLDFTDPALPLTANHEVHIQPRHNGSDFIEAFLTIRTDNTVTIQAAQNVGGVQTGGSTVTVPGVTATTPMRIAIEAVGANLRVKAWPTSGTEPFAWQSTFTTTLTAVGVRIDLLTRLNTGNTNTLPLSFAFDNYSVTTLTPTGFPWARFYARRFGRTTVPLLLDSPNITGGGVYQITLTPEEWDALPELIDGYKEITKRFAVAPPLSAYATPQWRFSASGEVQSNRWEVRGAIAPAISGIGGNRLNQVPTADRLDTATYGGSSVNLGWIPGSTTPVTTTTDDPAADAVLMFAADPATITGLAVTPSLQSLTGFAECGSGPCCIPTALSYNRITWPLPPNTVILLDDFNRTATTGFGTAISGGAYAYTDAFSQYFLLSDGRAAISPTTSGIQAIATLAGALDVEITATVAVTGIVTGTSRPSLIARFTDVNNYYQGLIQTDPSGNTILNLIQQVGGVGTSVANVPVPFTILGGGEVRMKFLVQTWGATGVKLKLKAWPLIDDEPDFWHIEVDVPSGALTGTGTGFAGRVAGAASALVIVDDFAVSPPRYWFDSYELQRRDDVTDWQTIMRATDVTTTFFNDYEARAGLTSSYRMRQRNVLLFDGQWSITGTGAIAEPGVTLPSCGTTKRGVLIFTTNADQTGGSNLAYAMTWDNNVVESFSFPETDTLSVDRYLDRDYQVAFHGTERGGEQFSRRLLLANAAVALPRLANMRSLRDLAWDDVPYVCVRDDIGDRWFATIVVTGGEVRRGRRLYNANLAVIETTGTAAEVNP